MVGCNKVLFQAQSINSRDGRMVDVICGNCVDILTKKRLFCHECQANTNNSNKARKD